MRVIIVGPASAVSRRRIELRRHGFDDGRCSRRPPSWAGPGTTTATPARRATYQPLLFVLLRAAADWARLCSPQPEILDYLRGIATDFDVARRIVTTRRSPPASG